MLLSEQVRRLPNEKNLIDAAAGYSRNACGWAEIHNYGNITLTQNNIVILTYTAGMSCIGGGNTCAHRIKVGGLDVSGFQFAGSSNVSESITVIFFLAAGTYAVTADGAGDYYDGNNYRTISISNFKLGILDFADVVGFSVAAYSATITKNLPVRKLAVGTIKNGVMHIQITTNNAAVGASLPAVSVDGVTRSWAWSKTGQAAGSFCNSYGSVCGRIDITLTAGTDHTITLSGGAGTHYISIAFTPWILPTSLSEPVTLDFPQGSTLYITTEPLIADPTKNVKIGKARAISFGDTTDYYSTLAGTGILNYNYTFETVEIANCVLLVDGYGGCISIIGVDVR